MAVIHSGSVHIVARSASSTLATSYGRPAESRDHVVVTLASDNGQVGWGEASPLPFFTGETPGSICGLLESHFLPAVIGLDPVELGVVHASIEKALPGNSSAKAAVDMAAHDLAARILGVPVSTMLGGARRRGVPITRPIGITSVEDAIEQANRYVTAGHRTLKLKVGINARADIERLRAVRDAVGFDVQLRIDANQGYDLATAHHVLRKLESIGLEYCEQPLPRWDIADLARLRASVGVRIAVDESLHDIRDAMALIQARAVDVFVIKLIKTAGLLPAKRITDLGEASGVAATVVSPFDTQVGAAHALQLALTLPEGGPACELTVFATQADLADSDHQLDAGTLRASLNPGCGVERLAELERAA